MWVHSNSASYSRNLHSYWPSVVRVTLVTLCNCLLLKKVVFVLLKKKITAIIWNSDNDKNTNKFALKILKIQMCRVPSHTTASVQIRVNWILPCRHNYKLRIKGGICNRMQSKIFLLSRRMPNREKERNLKFEKRITK